MTADERLERCADLVVRVGANGRAGQEVRPRVRRRDVPIAHAVAHAALRAGARGVDAMEWREARPAIIRLTGNADPGLFAALDPVLDGKAEPKDLRALCLSLVEGKTP